ncbi:MAG: glycosyltransferase family 4 protein [bacterium]|nr:glycosyltransferase family 4 protein [bacterium]
MTGKPWSAVRPTNLHLGHSWGGGLGRWVEDFAAADHYSENLVLESIGTYECYGIELRLSHPRSGRVLGSWVLEHPIAEIRAYHPECAAILTEVCETYGIGHIYVSSLVGLSLDVFRLGMPMTRIYHDYSPYCPAFFITRGEVCTSCSLDDLRLCKDWQTSHRPKNSPRYYLELRDELFEAVAAAHVAHVIPSLSVRQNLCRLDSRFADLELIVIEHGINHRPRDCFGGAEPGRRLRVGLLGILGWNKGLDSLTRNLDTWRVVADLHLIGSHDPGIALAERWGTQFVHNYSNDDLPAVLEEHRLDLALFISQVPETFSFTLSEAWCHCVPPAARSIGAHADRIEHGTDGFLFGLEDSAALDFLLWADRERDALRQLAARLREKPVRTVEDAVRDYYRLRSEYPAELKRSLERVS